MNAQKLSGGPRWGHIHKVKSSSRPEEVHFRTLPEPCMTLSIVAVEGGGSPPAISLQRSGSDERWVPCARPVAIAGGEFTLEMLDLQYSSDVKFYDAPLHVKAINGMLLIDDFGRQKFRPDDLLNRWIVPMENKIDYLQLHTGASFSLPFDVLLIFSTNLQPEDLMDAAFFTPNPI